MSDNTNINVEEIMAEIRQRIKDEHLTSAVLSFDDVPLMSAESLLKGGYDPKELQVSTEYVAARSQVVYNVPIEGNPLKCFVKRLIRKLVQFYVVPMVEQQNALNRNYSSAMLQVNGFIQKAGEKDSLILSSRIDELELKELYSKKEIAELKEQIKLLKDELAELRKA